MKRFTIILLATILASLAWMGFVREPLPAIPEISHAISEEVPMRFSINSMNASGVELALNQPVNGKGMYVQFQMSNAWKTGRTGLVLKGIRPNSNLANGMSPKAYLNNQQRKAKGGKDFSDFMKDNRGSSVATYTFDNTLVESTSGDYYLQMSYDGPAMEMLQTLEIPRPVTVPGHISRQFIPNGVIQFQPGTVAFDSQIKGFNIPVVIR